MKGSEKFDLLLILGDRYELLGSAIAAMTFRIPIAHIHGGELTEGAIDESIRHSVTKMSHIHFASNEVHKNRIIQLGETPDRVFNVGAPGLDYIKNYAPDYVIFMNNDIVVSLKEKGLL